MSGILIPTVSNKKKPGLFHIFCRTVLHCLPDLLNTRSARLTGSLTFQYFSPESRKTSVFQSCSRRPMSVSVVLRSWNGMLQHSFGEAEIFFFLPKELLRCFQAQSCWDGNKGSYFKERENKCWCKRKKDFFSIYWIKKGRKKFSKNCVGKQFVDQIVHIHFPFCQLKHFLLHYWTVVYWKG